MRRFARNPLLLLVLTLLLQVSLLPAVAGRMGCALRGGGAGCCCAAHDPAPDDGEEAPCCCGDDAAAEPGPGADLDGRAPCTCPATDDGLTPTPPPEGGGDRGVAAAIVDVPPSLRPSSRGEVVGTLRWREPPARATGPPLYLRLQVFLI